VCASNDGIDGLSAAEPFAFEIGSLVMMRQRTLRPRPPSRAPDRALAAAATPSALRRAEAGHRDRFVRPGTSIAVDVDGDCDESLLL
jgi:hypothetical protein